MPEPGLETRLKLTGTVCHLEAAMVQNAMDGWNLGDLDFLFIERRQPGVPVFLRAV